MKDIVNFLHEAEMLSATPRSGFAFLGRGRQSVAEHTFGMSIVAFALARRVSRPVNLERLLLLCLMHDLPEARTGDLNYVNKKYVRADEKAVIEEIRQESPLGPEIAGCLEEYRANQTVEANLAHDADQLELLLVLKQQIDTGNPRARFWFDNTVQRLSTPEARELAKSIGETPSDQWWLKDPRDLHWVHGGKARE